jgi:hypothetical protein
MANGILASETLTATTYTSIYGPPADTFSVVTVNICNKNATSIQVRLAMATNGSPGTPVAGEYIEYQTEILPNGVLERSGVVIQNGRTIYAYSTQANTDVVVYGIETLTA